MIIFLKHFKFQIYLVKDTTAFECTRKRGDLSDAMQIIDKYHFIRKIIWVFEKVSKREKKRYGKENRVLLRIPNEYSPNESLS